MGFFAIFKRKPKVEKRNEDLYRIEKVKSQEEEKKEDDIQN